MKRFFISVVSMAAFGFGAASPAQAQIVYGYTSPDLNGGTSSYASGSNYSWFSTYTPSDYSQSSGGYSSPFSVTAYPTLYPPIGPNYRLSPVSRYGSSTSGLSTGYGMTPFTMSPMYGGMRPQWMNSGFGGTMGPMWMRRR